MAAARDNVVVVGAGIIGASIGYHLARRGAQVTILEKHRPASGATRDSFAWLNAFRKQPFSYYRLNVQGILGWRRLQNEIGPQLRIQWGGGVAWCRPDVEQQRELEQTVRQRQAWGYPIRSLDEPALRRLLPGIEPGPFGGGWFCGSEGTLDPITTTEVLIQAAETHGAKLMSSMNVERIEKSGPRELRVLTNQGSVAANVVVIAAGIATPALAAGVQLLIPLKTSRGILAYSKPCAPLLERVIMPPGIDMKQQDDGRIVTGANFADSGDQHASPQRGQELLGLVQQFIAPVKQAVPALELDFVRLGYRVLPIDGHPIVGRSLTHPDVHVVATHSGITLAPIIGELLASEILEGAEARLLAEFRPSRFASG